MSLYLVRGLPGSGKSTFARETYFDHVHLEADMWFIDNAGNYNFNPDNLHIAHRWCQDTTRILLQNDFNVIVSNTFTTLKEMKYYLDLSYDLDIPLKVYTMTTMFGSTHNVPDEVIERMKQRWQAYDDEVFVT